MTDASRSGCPPVPVDVLLAALANAASAVDQVLARPFAVATESLPFASGPHHK
jgi:hypothetical protein